MPLEVEPEVVDPEVVLEEFEPEVVELEVVDPDVEPEVVEPEVVLEEFEPEVELEVVVLVLPLDGAPVHDVQFCTKCPLFPVQNDEVCCEQYFFVLNS